MKKIDAVGHFAMAAFSAMGVAACIKIHWGLGWAIANAIISIANIAVGIAYLRKDKK